MKNQHCDLEIDVGLRALKIFFFVKEFSIWTIVQIAFSL